MRDAHDGKEKHKNKHGMVQDSKWHS